METEQIRLAIFQAWTWRRLWTSIAVDGLTADWWLRVAQRQIGFVHIQIGLGPAQISCLLVCIRRV
jgi:hypothetical protein